VGQNSNIQKGNKSFERMQQFKYLRKTIPNQNSIHKETESSLKSGKACYHSTQNLLSSSLPSRRVEIKIYRTVILPLFCMGVKVGHSQIKKNEVDRTCSTYGGEIRTGFWWGNMREGDHLEH
jgi:hypothetical protein